ncbi:MAG: NAD-dependent epimerase/dehydratase family protein [Anaerolineae bacterium]
MPTHALVTGGGGFLGRYIVEQLLDRGDRVTVFCRGNYPALQRLGALLIRGDISDLHAITKACAGIDVVYHVAAKTGVWGPRSEFYAVNVTGTENVIEACRAQGVAKLVYTSSPSVIFDGTDQCGVDESHPYPSRYENAYPETKALGEQRVLAANGHDLLTVSLRPHLVFGPRDNHLLPALIERARKGLVPQVGDGKNRVDLTYVEDAAAAHLLAADAMVPGSAAAGEPGAGAVYFISQGEPVTLWPWVRDLLAQLDLPPIRVRIPQWAARAAGTALAALYRGLKLKGEPPLTPFLASELAQSHYYDISRARRDLGYRPAYTMAEATRRTVAWLKTRDT